MLPGENVAYYILRMNCLSIAFDARPAEGPHGGRAPAKGPRGGGRPPRGPWGAGAPAEGPGGVSPNSLYKAPTDYTKTRQTIQSPDRLYKAPNWLYRDLEILDKDIKELKNIATNIKLTHTIKDSTLKTTYISKKVSLLLKGI